MTNTYTFLSDDRVEPRYQRFAYAVADLETDLFVSYPEPLGTHCIECGAEGFYFCDICTVCDTELTGGRYE